MLPHGRQVLAFIAFSVASASFAASPLPPDLQSLHVKAENGNAVAQYNLGLAYATGRGIPVDREQAFVWLSLAAERGATGKALGTLIAKMSPGELEAANRLLDQTSAIVASNAPAALEPEAPSPTPVPTEAPASTAPARPEASAQPMPVTAAQDPEVAQLRAKLKDLQEISAHQSALNQQLSTQLDERAQALLGALSQLSAAKQLLEGQDSKKEAELSAARKQLEAANVSIDDLKNQQKTSEESKEDLNVKISSLQQDLARSKTDSDAMWSKLNQDESALRSAGNTKANAEALVAELAKAKSDLESTRAELAKTQKNADDLFAKLAADEAALKKTGIASSREPELTSDLAAARKALDASNAAAAAAKTQDAALGGPSLEKEVNDRTAKIEELTAALAARSKTPSDSANPGTIQALQTQLASTQKALDAAIADAANAKKQDAAWAASLEKEVNDRTAKIEELTAALATRSKTPSDSGNSPAFQALQAQLASTQKALDGANSDAANLKKQDAAWAASLEKELAASNAKADDLSRKLASDEASLRASGDSGAKAQSLASELAKAREDLASTQSRSSTRRRGTSPRQRPASCRGWPQSKAISPSASPNPPPFPQRSPRLRSQSAPQATRARGPRRFPDELESSPRRALDVARTALDSSKKEAGSKSLTIQQLRDERESTRSQLAAVLANASAAKDQAAAKISSLQDDVAKRASEIATLSARLAADDAALKSAGDAGARAQAQASEIASARQAADAAKEQLAQAQKAVTASRAEVASKQAEIDALVSNNAAMHGQFVNDQTALSKKADADRAAAASRISALEGRTRQAVLRGRIALVEAGVR